MQGTHPAISRGAILLVIVALTACASSASPSQPALPTTPMASETAAPSDAVSTTLHGAKEAPSAPHDVPDLEGLIPAALGGMALTKSSHHAGPDEGVDAWAAGVGKAQADEDLALAATTGTGLDQFLTAELIWVRGADTGDVRDVLLAAAPQQGVDAPRTSWAANRCQ
jgi:hypothetical protein